MTPNSKDAVPRFSIRVIPVVLLAGFAHNKPEIESCDRSRPRAVIKLSDRSVIPDILFSPI